MEAGLRFQMVRKLIFSGWRACEVLKEIPVAKKHTLVPQLDREARRQKKFRDNPHPQLKHGLKTQALEYIKVLQVSGPSTLNPDHCPGKVQAELYDVQLLRASVRAFAALRKDGQATWLTLLSFGLHVYT